MWNFFKKKEKIDDVNKEIEAQEVEKPSGGHGSHFDASFISEKIAYGLVEISAKQPNVSEEFSVKLPEFNKTKLIVNTKVLDDSLMLPVLLVNKELYSAYPVNRNFTALKGCTTPSVQEWKNELEAWVSINAGSANLTFFPIDYYKNKKKYASSKKLDIGFSAMAYSISVAKNEELKTKNGTFKTGKMCSLIPLTLMNKGFPDDYSFRGEILEIRKDKVKAKSYFVKVINSPELQLSFWIRCSDHIAKQEFKVGDFVSGNLWLQGTIIN